MKKTLAWIVLAVIPLLFAGTIGRFTPAPSTGSLMRDTDRRFGVCEPFSLASTTLGPLGGSTIGGGDTGFGLGGVASACVAADGLNAGTVAAAVALTNGTRYYVTYTTNTANTSYGYFQSNVSNTDTRILYKPVAVFIVHSGSNTAATWWFGLEESLTLGNLLPSDTQATAVDHAAIGVTAAGAIWRCCSGDGTNASCTDITGSTFLDNMEYRLTVDMRTAAQTRCCVSDLTAPVTGENCITKTTNQPGTAINMGMIASVKTTAAGTKTISVNRMYLEQN